MREPVMGTRRSAMGTRRKPTAAGRHGERGVILIVTAFAMLMLLGFVAFVVDAGQVFVARRYLQASTDAAAAAGGIALGLGENPVSAAEAYSSAVSASGQNQLPSYLSNTTIAVTSRCANVMAQLLYGRNCAAGDPVNVVTVTQQASVNLHFARLLGFTSKAIAATAMASKRGGSMPPLDVMIVLDATQSMNSGSPTRLTNAKSGIRALLAVLAPCQVGPASCSGQTAIDAAGLTIFPGYETAADVGYAYDCNGSPDSDTVSYTTANARYEIIPLSTDYRVNANASTGLNTESNFVKAVNGRPSCTGLEAIGGQGSFFATAITSAQASLVAYDSQPGRSHARNVIVFVSDGDTDQNIPPSGTNQCQKTINAASAAKSAGTIIYSIGFGAGNNSISGCSGMTTRSLMTQIATDTSKYFETPANADLAAVFRRVSNDFMTTRLFDPATP